MLEFLDFCLKCENYFETEKCFYCNLIPGKDWTKTKREEMFGNVSKQFSMNPENFQRLLIQTGTRKICDKSDHIRINKLTLTLEKKSNPFKDKIGFEYTEDFDGVQTYNDKKIYFNFKFTVGQGGSQLRTLKDVYSFIETQLKLFKNKNIYFANILDGDIYFSHKLQFDYLINEKYKNSEMKSQIYVGDTKDFFNWIKLVKTI